MEHDFLELERPLEATPLVAQALEQPVRTRSLARLRLEREINGIYHSDRRRTNTIIGSSFAVVVLLLLLLTLSILDITPYVRREERRTIPIELLQYGVLGSSEANKGNLSAEGKATKAPANPELLADAAKINTKENTKLNAEEKVNTKLTKIPTTTPTPLHTQAPKTLASAPPTREYTQPSYTKPVSEQRTTKAAESDTKSQELQSASSSSAASAKTAAGTPQGSTANDAEGIGRFGSGTGRGQGYGIEWGGGGNRVVVHKELPKYPAGVNTTTQIKIRFSVNPNGTVGMILPMQKGDPLLERAAIEALRRWQFNPLTETKEMVGFITFTFRVQ